MEDKKGVNSTPSLDNIKVHAVEAEPVIDKVFSFTITFGIKKSTQRWRVTHSFARFKVLDMFLRKYAPRCIYSRFPKDGSLSILGIRRKKDLENRRLMLDIWIREVVANSELFPEDIQLNLWDFMRVPAKISAILQPRALLSRQSGKGRGNNSGGDNDVDSVDSTISNSPSSELHSKMRKSHRMARHQMRRWVPTVVAPPSAPRKKSIPERMIRTVRRKLRNLSWSMVCALYRLMVPTPATDGTAVVCLGRNELLVGGRASALTGASLRPLQDAFLCQMANHAITFLIVAVGTVLLDCTVGQLVCLRYGVCLSTTAELLVACSFVYTYLLCLDYDRLDGETARGLPSYLHVQESLRVFLDSPTLEYTDEAFPFPAADDKEYGSDTDDEADVWRDVGGHSDDTHAHGNGSGSGPQDHHLLVSASGNASPNFASSSQKGAGAGVNNGVLTALGATRGVFGMSVSMMKKIPQKLHETLVPGSSFDKCEFNDVSAEARAMYTCRAETHPLKVRGETYMDDQKKVAPGPAMSRLMLLELYGVEAKDGDRHDHVVSRGKAKQRLEALRTLPEKLFFFVLNIQIPGDPPVSIVSYFAMPLDLIERYPGRATAKFLEMFEKFADAPRTERERLAAWGITVEPEAVPEAVAEVEVEAEGEGEEAGEEGQPDVTGTETATATEQPERRMSGVSSDGLRDGHGHSQHGHDGGDKKSSVASPSTTQPHAAATSKSPPTRDPTPEHLRSGALSKISQAKKIVREAAALGGGGLRRMSNYIIGHHSSEHDTAHEAATTTTSPDAAHPSIIMRLRSNSDSREKRRDGHENQNQGQGLQVANQRGSFLSSADEPLTHASAADGAGAKDTKDSSHAGSDKLPVKRKVTNKSSSSGSGSQSQAMGDIELSESVKSVSSTGGGAAGSAAGVAAGGAGSGGGGTAGGGGGRSVTPPGMSSSAASGAAAGTGLTPLTIPAATPAPAPASAPAAAPAKGSAWLPADITWPTAYDPGALPPTDYRNERFKLIPSITEGPWVVRAAVRATPAMLGKKVVQRYFRGEDYLEIDVHVGSSIIASNIVGVCRGYAKHMVNDCGVVIQGEGPAELPERMLACVSLNNIDVNIRMKLDD